MQRTLIVDDNKESAQTMGWLMEIIGHEVELAFDGKSALEKSSSAAFDIILLDINLPDINGYELLERLKKNPQLSDATFVAQTGWDRKEDHERSIKAGFQYHLVKPVDVEWLKEISRSVDQKKNA